MRFLTSKQLQINDHLNSDLGYKSCPRTLITIITMTIIITINFVRTPGTYKKSIVTVQFQTQKTYWDHASWDPHLIKDIMLISLIRCGCHEASVSHASFLALRE